MSPSEPRTNKTHYPGARDSSSFLRLPRFLPPLPPFLSPPSLLASLSPVFPSHFLSSSAPTRTVSQKEKKKSETWPQLLKIEMSVRRTIRKPPYSAVFDWVHYGLGAAVTIAFGSLLDCVRIPRRVIQPADSECFVNLTRRVARLRLAEGIYALGDSR